MQYLWNRTGTRGAACGAVVAVYISAVFNGLMKATGLIQYGDGVSVAELILIAGIVMWMQIGKSRMT